MRQSISAFKGFDNMTADEIYKADIELAKREGVRQELALPFYERRSRSGVLLIHGFSASPHEVLPLATELLSRGLTVYAPRVAGHGTSIDDLISKSYLDWYESLAAGYFALKNSCDKVTVIGQSNGGLLASAVALNNDINALGLLAPAFKVRLFGFCLVKYLQYFLKYIPRHLKKEELPYNYKGFACKSLYDMILLQKYISKNIDDINIPVLLAVSENDILISPKTAINYLKLMKSIDKNLKLYDNNTHKIKHILTEKGMTHTISDISDWVERINR